MVQRRTGRGLAWAVVVGLVTLTATSCLLHGPRGAFAARPDSVLVFDLPCGPEPYNRYDVLLPRFHQDTPLVIYIHGGSFYSGDKDDVYESAITEPLLSAGVAVASINYALLGEPGNDGVITSLDDIADCVQHIVETSDSFDVDADRVAYVGDSAGGGAALWLGLGDDRADPTSADPVARQSTTPRAVVGFEAQATYDVDRWVSDVFAEYGLTEAYAWANYPIRPMYAITTLDELHSVEGLAYRARIDMLDEIDAGDPPIYLSSTEGATGFPWTTLAMYHHPNHARALVDAADAVGLEAVADAPRVGLEPSGGETVVAFLLRHLDV